MIDQTKELLSENRASRIANLEEVANTVFDDRPILAKVAVCQAILESNLLDHPSKLAINDNNLFGIKGRGTAGESRMLTHEFVNGQEITVKSGFAVNNNVRDSFMQYRELLYHPRYEDVLNAKTVEIAFEHLQKDGYATDPHYAKKLERIYKDVFSVRQLHAQSNDLV